MKFYTRKDDGWECNKCGFRTARKGEIIKHCRDFCYKGYYGRLAVTYAAM